VAISITHRFIMITRVKSWRQKREQQSALRKALPSEIWTWLLW